MPQVRRVTLKLPCLDCGVMLTVTLTPGCSATRYDPSEPATLEEVVGCDHAEVLGEDPRFEDDVMARLNEEMESRYEDEMEARYERKKERGLDDA